MNEALERFLRFDDVRTVLDVGAGIGDSAELLRKAGRRVKTISLTPPADIVGDYMGTDLGPVDGIWCSHCLEHVGNTQAFLEKIFGDLRGGGALAITVPPLKHEIVGGHVSLWNAGLLLYRLVLAGFDCSKASVGTWGYNVSAIVRKVPAELPTLDSGPDEIDRLKRYFPVEVYQGFDGQLANLAW